jgi:hypothetical protein
MASSSGRGWGKPHSGESTPFFFNLFGCGYAALGLFCNS